MLRSMEKLDSFSNRLQHEATTLAEVHGLFDTVMEHFPSTVHWLSSDAEIIESKEFESAIVKL